MAHWQRRGVLAATSATRPATAAALPLRSIATARGSRGRSSTASISRSSSCRPARRRFWPRPGE
jgi:hypothetical protein